MSISNSHKNAVDRQFGEQANAYLTSAVHAQGKGFAAPCTVTGTACRRAPARSGLRRRACQLHGGGQGSRWWPTICRAQMLAVVEQAAAEKA